MSQIASMSDLTYIPGTTHSIIELWKDIEGISYVENTDQNNSLIALNYIYSYEIKFCQ